MNPSRQTFAGQDDADLAFALREIAVARAQLGEAHAIADRLERTAAIMNALAHAQIAERAIADLITRRTPRVEKHRG